MEIDILAFGAHPDDIEMGCGGILAKAAAEGKTIALCDLTLGQKGSNGTPEGRKQEALDAAKLIGAERTHLTLTDCEVFDTYEGRLELVKVIRHYKPKLVLASVPHGTCQHPDHFACGQMARYACRYARFSQILPNLPPHTPQGILHYTRADPDFLIDISGHVDTWRQMILCHKSQMQTRPYLEWCEKYALYLGTQIGVEYAQGLAAFNPLAIDDPLDLAKGTIEL